MIQSLQKFRENRYTNFM